MTGAMGPVRPRATHVLGTPVAPLRIGEAVAWIAAWVKGEGARMVCTVNPEIVMEARRNPPFRRVLEESDLNVVDGIGVLLAGRLAGDHIPERVAGVDLVEALCDAGDRLGWSLFLLGGRAGVAQAAAAALTEGREGLRLAGCSDASAAPELDGQTVGEINAASPDILLVAFGAPVQEFWIKRNLSKLDCRVAIGVGGTFDYLAGRASRAPKTLRSAGLEWAFRLVMEPWRWRRMSALPVFATLAVAEAARKRANGFRRI